MAETAELIWEDGPISNPSQPSKSRIRAWGKWIETMISAFTSNGGLVYTTRALLFDDLNHDPWTMAWVVQDPVAANNGIYLKSFGPGAGFWTRVADLPYSVIRAVDTGAGPGYAIQATSSLPVTESSLVIVELQETNPSSPVTISFNSSAPLTIKTNSGQDPIPGGLPAILLGYAKGTIFRLVSDQTSATFQAALEALVAQAEAAVDAASDYADFARNNWANLGPYTGTGVQTDYLLSIDPGTANNMFVVAGGVMQLLSDGAYSLVYSGGSPYIRIKVPLGIKFEVRVSNAINVNTPSDLSVSTSKLVDGAVTLAKMASNSVDSSKIVDGSISTSELADNAITYAKMQDVSATKRLLGRKTSGSGDPEEISDTDLRDTFLPVGSVIDSVAATPYATNADLSTVIPIDDTIPQITEGTQILTASITPKSTTNKLRIRFRAEAVVDGTAPQNIVWAIFNGGANAIRAGVATIGATGAVLTLSGEVEYVPGVTTAQTITVRIGGASGRLVRLNGSSAGRLLGGASAATLIVEEIKA